MRIAPPGREPRSIATSYVVLLFLTVAQISKLSTTPTVCLILFF